MTMASTLFTALLIFSVTLALFTPSSAYNILYSGETLKTGKSLTQGNYKLTMQEDCNLVFYDNGQAIWSSGTYNRAKKCHLAMQFDGNLVIYSGSTVVWASNTARYNANYVLVLQKDRNLVIYGPAIWATGTNIPGSANVVIAGKTN